MSVGIEPLAAMVLLEKEAAPEKHNLAYFFPRKPEKK